MGEHQSFHLFCILIVFEWNSLYKNYTWLTSNLRLNLCCQIVFTLCNCLCNRPPATNQMPWNHLLGWFLGLLNFFLALQGTATNQCFSRIWRQNALIWERVGSSWDPVRLSLHPLTSCQTPPASTTRCLSTLSYYVHCLPFYGEFSFPKANY